MSVSIKYTSLADYITLVALNIFKAACSSSSIALKQHHIELARSLLESLLIRFGDENEFTISQDLIKPIEYWLEWMKSEQLKDAELGFWFCDRLGNFLVNFTSSDTHALFVDEFNKKGSQYRQILATYILPKITNLTTDMLSEDAIQYLLAALNKEDGERDILIEDESLLGSIATESFVEERLLPLLSLETEPIKSNLRRVLRRAGRQHRHRYITEKT